MEQEVIVDHLTGREHIKLFDTSKICSCLVCIRSWDNLCLVVDLAHFQGHLHHGIPIPKLAHADKVSNYELLNSVAAQVEKAMQSPLNYAAILELHLFTIVSTITRKHPRGRLTIDRPNSGPPVMIPLYRVRPYNLTDEEAMTGTDQFLERKDKASEYFPRRRGCYYGLGPYLPCRSWSNSSELWVYHNGGHQRAVAFAGECLINKLGTEKAMDSMDK